MSTVVYVERARHPACSQWPVGQTGLRVGTDLAVQHGERVTLVHADAYDTRTVLDDDGQWALAQWAEADRDLARCRTDPPPEDLADTAEERASNLLAHLAGGEPACQVISPIQERARATAYALDVLLHTSPSLPDLLRQAADRIDRTTTEAP